MMTDTPPVAPVEGHYALLRNGWICMVQIQKGWMKEISDFALSVTSINERVPLWNLDTGQSLHDSPEYDIIGTISPETMQAIANGELERLRAVLKTIANANGSERPDASWDASTLLHELRKVARAALQGKQ